VCGDPWNTAEPRNHELGGRYVSGIIVRRYRPGDVVPVVVELTAAHAGYFEFRVCPVEHHRPTATENSTTSTMPRDPSSECLDRNVLPLVSRSGDGMQSRRYAVGPRAARMHAIDVQLPAELECKHCLFQWKYHAGKHIADHWRSLVIGLAVKIGDRPMSHFLVATGNFQVVNLTVSQPNIVSDKCAVTVVG